MMHWKISLVIAALLTSMTGAALYYRALYRDAEQARQHIEAQAESQHAALARVNRQMQTVAALDWKYTRELEHDKNRIAQLERDVAAGRRRLQVRATCTSLSAVTGTSSVGNATTPSITEDAERNYWYLRYGIETVTKQVNYLQEYVKNSCMNEEKVYDDARKTKK